MDYSREACFAWLAGGGLSPDQIREILNADPDPAHALEKVQTGEFLMPPGMLSERIIQALRLGGRGGNLEKWQQVMETCRIQVTCFLDDDFPERLRLLPDAPALLFYQGNLSALNRPSAAMVGSRNASFRGVENTKKVAEGLSRAGVCIISGLAYGIDAAAHEGCLRGGSPTAAVLGCGLDQDYPAENADLKKRILAAGGLVLSEYIPGEKPLGWHFPYRNRIISGLGDCLILMEARIRSGSMTSVQHALNQGKDVFVHPGEPGSARSEGNHQLLREGAIYFTTAEDIQEDMGWLDKKRNVGQNNGSFPSGSAGPALSAMEEKTLRALGKGEMGFEQLCDVLGMPAAMLNASLSMLQIQGLIQALPGKKYQRIESD